MTELLTIDGLSLDLMVEGRMQPVLRDVSFAIPEGHVLGLVGESGSGKTMTARRRSGCCRPARRPTGAITFAGRPVLGMSQRELRAYRATDVAMIFQDPRAHINPVRRVGDFLTEALIRVKKVKPAAAQREAVRALTEVRIDDPERRLRQYPHEMSGGMLQRVMIACTLLAEPRLILADEPTTALDVTTQAEVIALLDVLRRERGMAMLFITHDLELAAAHQRRGRGHVRRRDRRASAGGLARARAAPSLLGGADGGPAQARRSRAHGPGAWAPALGL